MAGLGRASVAETKLCIARPICLRLLVHWARRAASRADCTAGSSRAIRTAIIAITTRSSIRVKPRRHPDSNRIDEPPRREMKRKGVELAAPSLGRVLLLHEIA